MKIAIHLILLTLVLMPACKQKEEQYPLTKVQLEQLKEKFAKIGDFFEMKGTQGDGPYKSVGSICCTAEVSTCRYNNLIFTAPQESPGRYEFRIFTEKSGNAFAIIYKEKDTHNAEPAGAGQPTTAPNSNLK